MGCGAWSTVHEYKNKKTDTLCAGKLIVKEYIMKKGPGAIENLNMELQTLKEIDHLNIVEIKELLEGPKYIYIMMEYIKGGNL